MEYSKLHNPDYEKSLLGCILIDNDILDEYTMSDQLFYSPVARETFIKIVELRAIGIAVDLREVALCMPDKAGYVASLTDVASSANVKYYYENLVSMYQKRSIVKLARTMMERVDSGADVPDILDLIDETALQIDEKRCGGYKPLSDSLQKASYEIETACKNKGRLSGLTTGFIGLDDKTDGWQKQELIIIGARPGAGKTSIALNMASSVLKADIPVGIFSAEMSAVSLAKRLYADWANVDFGKLRSGFLASSEILSVAEATGALASRKLFINDKPSIPIRELVADARRMKRKEHIELLIVDYLSLISNEKQGTPRHEQVAEISMKLKGLARELEIPVIALSQLTREAQNSRPTLSQLRDSGAVEQDADLVILLHSKGFVDDQHREIKINLIVEKNRNGAVGTVPMIFKAPKMRFGETEQEW